MYLNIGWWGLIFRQIDDKHLLRFTYYRYLFVLIKQSDLNSGFEQWQDSGTLNVDVNLTALKSIFIAPYRALYKRQRVTAYDNFTPAERRFGDSTPNTHAHFDN